MPEKNICIPVKQFGEIAREVRNIRVELDGCYLIVDIVPAKVIGEIPEFQDPDRVIETFDDALENILKNARPIVEADECLRIVFDRVQAVLIQEECTDLHEDMGVLETRYPFVEVENSIWRDRLEDFEGGDDRDLKHYSLFSMETHIDILGYLGAGRWIKNMGSGQAKEEV